MERGSVVTSGCSVDREQGRDPDFQRKDVPTCRAGRSGLDSKHVVPVYSIGLSTCKVEVKK